MRTAVFTIISPNYRHYARVLMESVRREHPEWERFVLVVGDAAPIAEERFATIALDALNLPHARQFAFRYTLLELNTAVKPWAFEHLFARDFDRVVYLDPDIALFSRLEELENDAFLTLTPHLTGSIGGDEHPSERTVLLAGTYNLGFLAVTRKPDLARFLRWWQEKLEFQCVVDPPRGLFVDQKWLDLAPGLFDDVKVLRHDGYNVAYWNLAQRHVALDGPTVNGAPLRFFHFSGFDPAQPEFVSRHYHGLRLSEIGAVRKLFDDYATAVRNAGWKQFRDAPYAFRQFHDGTPLPDAARIAYRESPELQKRAGDDPFAHPELFLGIHDAPRRTRFQTRAFTASYQLLSRARPLVRLIPRPARTALREFLLGRKEPKRTVDATLPPGLNIVGYVQRATGVGESARLAIAACAAAGVPAHVVDIDSERTPHAVYRASVHHVNADKIVDVRNELRPLFTASAYNIGVWHWEMPELPDAWIPSAGALDEIWAPSLFVQSAVSRKVTIPVVHMPHGIAVHEIEPCSPEDLGVPRGRFTFLCMFDLGSVIERKNPLAAIEAFRRAFGSSSDAALLVKAGRREQHPDDYAKLEERVRDLPSVYLTDRMLPRARVNGLMAACDAVVSLHRSEGFGLILAEAMVLGKPVVATGWSGNMDFMTPANSCPVDYELVPLERTHGYYEAGQRWAEPDVDHAAHWMRRLCEDAELRTRIGARARETMHTQFSPEAAGLRYEQRLAFLGLMNRESHKPA